MGSFGLLSFHDNFDAYLLSAGVATDGEGGFVGADLQSIASAGTQLEVAVEGVVTSLVVNFSLEPQAQAGSDAAPDPYQAIFPLYLGYRLEGDLVAKVTGMFVLRSDTQGDIEQFNMSMLPEAVRIGAVSVMSQGLPQPELTKEQLALLGLDSSAPSVLGRQLAHHLAERPPGFKWLKDSKDTLSPPRDRTAP